MNETIHNDKAQLKELEQRLEGKTTYTTERGTTKENNFVKVFSDKEFKSLNKYFAYMSAFERHVCGDIRRRLNIERLYFMRRQSLKIPITDITVKNIDQVLNQIQSSTNSQATILGWKITLRKYLTWRTYGNKTLVDKEVKGDPTVVKYISTKVRKNEQKKFDINQVLTREECRLMLKNTKDFRDKCIISMLIETGARIGEVGHLRVKDVSYQSNPPHYIVDLSGKTGHRQNSILVYFKELNDWLSNHPLKHLDNFEEQPLFVNCRKNKVNDIVQCSYAVLRRIVKTTAKRSGIKKRVYPHLFRHTFATHKTQDRWTQEEIATWLGWSKTSKMFEHYSHTTTRDVIDKKLAMLTGEMKVYESEYLICKNSSCKAINNKLSELCYGCKLPLNMDDTKKYPDIYSEIVELRELVLNKMATERGHNPSKVPLKQLVI
jgi:integrase/recombinase XerD